MLNGKKINEALFRGPGLYQTDIDTITEYLKKIEEHLTRRSSEPELLQKIAVAVIELKSVVDRELKQISEDFYRELKNISAADKSKKPATADALNKLDQQLTAKLMALHAFIDDSLKAGGGNWAGSPGNLLPAKSGQSVSSPPPPKSFPPPDIQRSLGKIRQDYEQFFDLLVRRFKGSDWWEIINPKGGNKEHSEILYAVIFQPTGTKVKDIAALSAIQESADRYLNPQSETYQKNALCLIFYTASLDRYDFDWQLWAEQKSCRVGLLPFDSLRLILEIWRADVDRLRDFLIGKESLEAKSDENTDFADDSDDVESVPDQPAHQELTQNGQPDTEEEEEEVEVVDDSDDADDADDSENYRYQAED